MRITLGGNRRVDRAALWPAIYMLVLLVLFALGVLENRVDSEGMGFLPLLLLTTPWSWLLMGLWDSPIWGSEHLGGHLAIFVTCNIISGVANSYILFLLIKWRQRKLSGLPKSGV